MFYKVTYINESEPNKVWEISTNQENVVKEAWKVLEAFNNIGKVQIESRMSLNDGEYKHFLTISKNGESDRPVHETPMYYPLSNNTTSWDEINPLKQHLLDKEKPEIRRLVWLCQSKKGMFEKSTVRADFNSQRDEAVRVLEAQGKSYSEIADTAKEYGVWNELVEN